MSQDALPTPASPSPREQMAFLIGEIVEWMETHRPGVSLGASSWRSGFADIAPEWAQLADWTMELSTQLSVEFLAASQADAGAASAKLDALHHELEQFERDYHEPPSLANRLIGRTGETRRKQATERAAQLEAKWRRAREEKDKQLSGLMSASQLAGLLMDASEVLLANAPAIVAQVEKQETAGLLAASNAFEQRALRRRVEMAALASGALRQALPRLQGEFGQQRTIANALNQMRNADQERLDDLRSRLSSSVSKAQVYLQPSLDPAAIRARQAVSVHIAPKRSAWSLAGLVRDGRMPHVSGGVGKALVRLRDEDLSNEDLVLALNKVLGANGVHRTWVPIGGAASGPSSLALAMLVSELGGPRGTLWTPAMRKALGGNIFNWANELDYYLPIGEHEQMPAEAHGMRTDHIFQAIYELAQDQPRHAVLLLAKAPHLPSNGKVRLRHGNSDEVDGLTWAAGWLRQFEKDLKQPTEYHWVQAVSRVCLEQMGNGYHRAPVLDTKEKVQDFCKLDKYPKLATCAVVMRDALRVHGNETGRLIAPAVWWEKVKFEAVSPAELALLETTCQAAALKGPLFAKLMAEWVGRDGRFPSNTSLAAHPVLSTLVEAGKCLLDKNAAVPVSVLAGLAKHAPCLLAELPGKRQVSLGNGARCSAEGDVAVWMAQLPLFKTASEAYAAIPGRAAFYGLSPTNPASIALWKLAVERSDMALASALFKCSPPPRHPGLDVHEAMERAWNAGNASPAQWAEWLDVSGQRPMVSLYPADPTRRVEFLGALLALDASPHQFNLTDPTVHLARWLAGADLGAGRKELAPGAMFELVSRALDRGVAAHQDIVAGPHLSAHETLFLDRLERVVETALRKMDCSLWSQPPADLAHAWREAYEARWARRRREDMGNAMPETQAQGGDFVIQGSSPSGVACWFYDTHALPPRHLAGEVDKTKIKQLADPHEKMVPGLHVRAWVNEGGARRIVGVDRSMEITPEISTKAVLDHWHQAAETLADRHGDTGEVFIEGLRYDRIPVEGMGMFRVPDDSANLWAFDLASPNAGAMAFYGHLHMDRPTPWTCDRNQVAIEVNSRDKVPLDMCTKASDSVALVRHPGFAAMAGGQCLPRDHGALEFDALMQALEEDASEPAPVSTRRRTMLAPLR